jgi:molybdopterin-synthase adenylyltransferase
MEVIVNERFSRQSFLGPDSQTVIASAIVGVVGLGGGGSHIVQQLAHLGFRNFVLYDDDLVEESNLNRLIGAASADAVTCTSKLAVALRMIRGLEPAAEVDGHSARWHDEPEPLRRCDLVFGCVDSFSERDQLEATCRRHMIPLIDIGLDITVVGDDPPLMGGQVILSMPGEPCMHCLGFLTEALLAKEASDYGDAGPRPQVVFGNGVLASAAVAIAVDLLAGWTRQLRRAVYLEYRGNEQGLRPHPRANDKGIAPVCPHYPLANVGAPVFRRL